MVLVNVSVEPEAVALAELKLTNEPENVPLPVMGLGVAPAAMPANAAATCAAVRFCVAVNVRPPTWTDSPAFRLLKVTVADSFAVSLP